MGWWELFSKDPLYFFKAEGGILFWNSFRDEQKEDFSEYFFKDNTELI